MAADAVWILGIHMTKFGKHPDKDTVDLACEATVGALADGDVTMRDVGILAAGNLMGGPGSIGQSIQKQVGQTGIPVYNVANACATGATAPKRPLGVHVSESPARAPPASSPAPASFSTPTARPMSHSPAFTAMIAVRSAVAPVAHALATL